MINDGASCCILCPLKIFNIFEILGGKNILLFQNETVTLKMKPVIINRSVPAKADPSFMSVWVGCPLLWLLKTWPVSSERLLSNPHFSSDNI